VVQCMYVWKCHNESPVKLSYTNKNILTTTINKIEQLQHKLY
jgi:hypothetical protein